MNCICHKLNGFVGRMMMALVLLSFGGMTGFYSLLHNHNLDSEPIHQNCAPCHWNQSSDGDTDNDPQVASVTLSAPLDETPGATPFTRTILSPTDRAPPVLS